MPARRTVHSPHMGKLATRPRGEYTFQPEDFSNMTPEGRDGYVKTREGLISGGPLHALFRQLPTCFQSDLAGIFMQMGGMGRIMVGCEELQPTRSGTTPG